MAVRSGCGQVSGGPRGVANQSYARMSAPISPPPSRKAELAGGSLRPCMRSSGCEGVLPAPVPRVLTLKEPQAGPHHLACVLVLPGSHLGPDERVQLGR